MVKVFGYITPVGPSLPAPRRIEKSAAAKWIQKQFTCYDTSENTCYADNTAGNCTVYDDSKHRAYHARVYFKKELGSEDLASGGRAFTRWHMEAAARNPGAQKSYDDFLRGLEIVGSQEHIENDGKNAAPEGMSIPEKQEILKELLGEKAAIPTDDAGLRKKLIELAIWERYVIHTPPKSTTLPRRTCCRVVVCARMWASTDDTAWYNTDHASPRCPDPPQMVPSTPGTCADAA